MNAASRRSGFTLVEVMIVVVIMAILAATVIPQFASSSDDAMESTGTFNLHTLRAQIQLYKAEHRGTLPDVLSKLTEKTDSTGASSATGAYGPYLQMLPENPFNNLSTVEAVTATPTSGDGSHGWQYQASTGGVWLDHATLFSK